METNFEMGKILVRVQDSRYSRTAVSVLAPALIFNESPGSARGPVRTRNRLYKNQECKRNHDELYSLSTVYKNTHRLACKQITYETHWENQFFDKSLATGCQLNKQ